MATEVEFEYNRVKVRLVQDASKGGVISTGGDLVPETDDLTLVRWRNGREWEDVTDDVPASDDMEDWEERTRQFINSRRTQLGYSTGGSAEGEG